MTNKIKVRTCHVCGNNRICYIWWDNILDMPVWMCKQDIAIALAKQWKEDKNNAIKEEQLWSSAITEDYYQL